MKDGLELKQKQLQLQYDQEQLNLRAKISEVEAEERVHEMFEERDGSSDHLSADKKFSGEVTFKSKRSRVASCVC